MEGNVEEKTVAAMAWTGHDGDGSQLTLSARTSAEILTIPTCETREAAPERFFCFPGRETGFEANLEAVENMRGERRTEC